MSERATPFHCPYCGEEDLRPQEEPQSAWLCTACRRVFTVKFVGLNLTTQQAGRGAHS
ncbi:Insertion element protein [Actinokineospora pegani]|uniref:Insertion element protein n=1 Tax=Actinokineospora pegani TaxID=2654637 RepID=UPI0012E9FE5C|nr:Insertion element protein [Actinokineospora pegani]